MAVRPIRFFPDPCLSVACKPASSNTTELNNLIEDLMDTMYASPGVGLAAPQIGVLQRVSVIDVSRIKRKDNNQNHGLIILINPRFVATAGTQTPREGCLSVPDLLANVHRYADVTVETDTREGGKKTVKTHGFEALALQHELDHLDGKLFLDRVVNIKTDIFRRKIH